MRWRIAAILTFALVCSVVYSQDDETDAFIRENPVLGNEVSYEDIPDYSIYPFLNLDANHIEFNGADWSDLRNRFREADDTVVAIVHIGDSHIQAEGATSVTRRRLQNKFGSAGRGLIIPFRLAGTNQPFDYSISSDAEFTTAKILKQPWVTEMGFTGISLSPKSGEFTFDIATRPDSIVDQSFDFIKVFGHGYMPVVLSVKDNSGSRVRYHTETKSDTIDIRLSHPVTNARIEFSAIGPCNIFGFKLENSMMGVEYSAIGNNGATFSSYNAIGTVGRDIKALSPNLVIISLGCNEAFGNVSDASMYNNIDLLVSDIKRNNPEAELLLVTPAECQRSTRGRRRRRTYSVNQNVKVRRNVILRYGRENGIPTYDWYEIAGGDGCSAAWLSASLLNTDRIHNTWKGYTLQGDLLYDALIKAIE